MFIFVKGCCEGIRGSGDADVRVDEERGGSGQGCGSQEGRAREEGPETSLLNESMAALNAASVRFSLYI